MSKQREVIENKPILTFVACPNGSGKTTLVEGLSREADLASWHHKLIKGTGCSVVEKTHPTRPSPRGLGFESNSAKNCGQEGRAGAIRKGRGRPSRFITSIVARTTEQVQTDERAMKIPSIRNLASLRLVNRERYLAHFDPCTSPACSC